MIEANPHSNWELPHLKLIFAQSAYIKLDLPKAVWLGISFSSVSLLHEGSELGILMR